MASVSFAQPPCVCVWRLTLARNGIPEDGVKLIHWKDEKLFLNFSTRTFIGYGEV
jgi:hypothetical protein